MSDLGRVTLTFPPIYILFHFSPAALGVVEPQGFPQTAGRPYQGLVVEGSQRQMRMAKRSVHLVLHQCLYLESELLLLVSLIL